MTIQSAKALLKAYNMVLTHRDGEFRVNFRGDKEDKAYFTDCLVDAVNTAKAMASHRDKAQFEALNIAQAAQSALIDQATI